MSEPRRIAAIRRLYLAKLENMPSSMSYEERVQGAKRALDKVLTPQWREEVKAIGLDPTDGAELEQCTENFYDRLTTATQEEGYKGEDVPPAPKGVNEIERRKDDKDDNSGIIAMLMKLIHGKSSDK